MSDSRAVINDRYGSPAVRRTPTKSANAPRSRRPTGCGQTPDNASPGLDVSIRTSSSSVKTDCALFHRSATFNSHNTFRVPDGAQSDPKHSRPPAAWAVFTSAVAPYNHRFENGDHTRLEFPAFIAPKPSQFNAPRGPDTSGAPSPRRESRPLAASPPRRLRATGTPTAVSDPIPPQNAR